MANSPFKYVLTGLLWILAANGLQAQFQQLPVDYTLREGTVQHENLRIGEVPLSLPFWDDFSQGNLDAQKWENRGVVTSMTLGINPPSVGVVGLDGVDGQGKPYSPQLLENGEGDHLISLDVDLSSLQPVDSVYLSFFWQAGGKAEMPDSNDQLALYFLDEDDNWIAVWQILGGDLETREKFTQEMIRLDGSFLHEKFRFRFVNSGRLSGPFDSWLIDYVFLDKGRTVYDIYHEDRTLTQLPSSPFDKYHAIPLFALNSEENDTPTTITNQFNNLSNRFRAMEYSIELRHGETGALFRTIHDHTPFNPVPQALERRSFQSVELKELGLEAAEEFDLETLVYLTTGDDFLIGEVSGTDTVFAEGVDYRRNDTVRHSTAIRDFFAYDNGSVDYAAGINQRSGMLAVRYELGTPAYIKGISINFTNASQTGNVVELTVWDDLDGPPRFAEEVTLPEKASLDEFSYFELDTNLRLSGTFYIGFTQFTNDFIHVGLDKSNDTGEEVFFNVAGSWEQNQEVSGSLMIRPHLSLDPIAEENTEEEGEEINAYPNPVMDMLYLEGNVDEIVVIDAYGRQINIPIGNYEKGKTLNFAEMEKGVYVVRAWTGKKPNSIRILVK